MLLNCRKNSAWELLEGEKSACARVMYFLFALNKLLKYSLGRMLILLGIAYLAKIELE